MSGQQRLTRSSSDSLAAYAKETGVRYFLISYTDLFGAQRAKLVPAVAIEDMQKDGAGFAGAVDQIGDRLDVILGDLGPVLFPDLAVVPGLVLGPDTAFGARGTCRAGRGPWFLGGGLDGVTHRL